MAHRLLIRRVWTLSVKDIRCLPSSAATISSSSFSTSLQSPPSRVSLLSPPRTLPRTLHQISRREVSFNVQDNEDFTERVINSQLPVLVDFHAQWVLKDNLLNSLDSHKLSVKLWMETHLHICCFVLRSPNPRAFLSSSWHFDVSQLAVLNLLTGKAPISHSNYTTHTFHTFPPEDHSGVFLTPYFHVSSHKSCDCSVHFNAVRETCSGCFCCLRFFFCHSIMFKVLGHCVNMYDIITIMSAHNAKTSWSICRLVEINTFIDHLF